MTRYTVLSLADDMGHYGSGLTLDEAFVRLMALAETDYRFERDGEVMRLTLAPRLAPQAVAIVASNPQLAALMNLEYLSRMPGDEDARTHLKLQAVKGGMKQYIAVTDEYFRQEEQGNPYAA